MNLYQSVLETVGKTPLVELCRVEKEYGLSARLLAKLEMRNPAGSIKDRGAVHMLKNALQSGAADEKTVLIEPTSGNTGIGLAMACAVLGNPLILTMPETMSTERRKLLCAYGAKIVLTDGAKGMSGAVEKAQELHAQMENSLILGQFENPDNPDAHYRGTGREIWEDTDGKADALIACIGTGGTLSGTGKYLKEQNPQISLIGVEPQESPLISEGHAGAHGIQGIGANFIPETLNLACIDEMITVHTQEALEFARLCARKEGILCGISGGAALCAAVKYAQRPETKGQTVVLVLPDTGERYLSTALFEEV